MCFKFECFWIYVSDIKKARYFYSEVLGFKVLFEDNETGWIEFLISYPNIRFACQEWGKTKETTNMPIIKFDSYKEPKIVISCSDLNSLLNNKIINKSIEPKINNISNIIFINIRDYDGNLIQIIEKKD
jgi:hypothetical protein